MSENIAGRRARKSAPVKNAIFVGAANKERCRLRDLGSECNSFKENRFEDSSVLPTKPDAADSPDAFHQLRSRPHDREKNQGPPPRMSTPMGRDRSSLRPIRPRRSERTLDESTHSSLGLPDFGKRKYHPRYDPYIEIRRARERLQQYKTKGNWTVDMLLSDDAEEDLQRYENKLKHRYSLRGDFNGELDLERRNVELLRRQRDIDMGKVTERYAEYVLTIPKPEREKHHPRTPNKFRTVSRRAWDGMIKKWRKHLHNFDNPDFNETWRSLSTETSMSATSNASQQQDSSDEAYGSNGDALTHYTPRTSDRCRARILDADEDTLEAMTAGSKKAVTSISDDDTLDPTSAASRFHPRGFQKRSDDVGSLRVPAPDVLHSGLTNDMTALSHKRVNEEINSELAVVKEVLSPQKRTRRSSGRLTKSQVTSTQKTCFAAARGAC